MNYEIGDTVVHWNHGLGKVIGIDEKLLAGVTQRYYVVEVDLLKLWVPVDEAEKGSIRLPLDSEQFKGLFSILQNPGEQLPDHQYQRKLELQKRMQKWTLVALCHIIRDLTDRSSLHPLNQNDASVLLRAEEHLIDEWVLSLNAKRSDAVREMKFLLHGEEAELLVPQTGSSAG